MSWIYRKHKGGLAESMATAREFETKEEMFKYIWEDYKELAKSLGYSQPPFDIEDIVINEDDVYYDERIGWHTMYVLKDSVMKTI